MRFTALGVINLAVFGVFMIVAGFGSIVPHIVIDRLTMQFKPLWRRVLFASDEEWSIVGDSFAVASQWVIGITEMTIGVAALAGVFTPKRRLALAQFSLGTATALFGTFMIVLFFLHEAELPKWKQYPAILVWIGVIWFLLNQPAQRPTHA